MIVIIMAELPVDVLMAAQPLGESFWCIHAAEDIAQTVIAQSRLYQAIGACVANAINGCPAASYQTFLTSATDPTSRGPIIPHSGHL